MTWLHVCSLSITLTSNYWCGQGFVGIMLEVIAKSGIEIYWLTKTEGVMNNTV